MKTILVAEDRDASRELICTVLGAAGYQVIEARDGREAVDRATATMVDLVLLDLYMPHLDGFAVLENLRARPEYSGVPVIALTASAMAGDRERAIACGFTEYISKPVNMASLRREIARLLGRPGRIGRRGRTRKHGRSSMSTESSVSLVIIDDNPGSLEMLSAALAREGVNIFTAQDPEEGIEIVFREHPQIVITDLVMPGLSGLEVLDRIVEFDPSIDVILMTAHYTSETAVDAIRRGASDYLNKPVSITALRERIGRLVEEARKRDKNTALETQMLETSQFEGMIGRSPAMYETFSRIRRVAPHYRTVLITGETGTGKDLAARALHSLSPVSTGHFVVLNCSAVVETLFESELFGHVRGSFTGASQDKMGLFEYADRGTIFLDEIGDMPLGTQAKLLRTLQNQEVLRVGSLTARKVDVHVIAATHQDLRKAIAEKRFREDLYYRLSMVEIHVPSLEEHKEDIPLLTRYLLERFSKQFHKEIRGLTQRAQIVISRHHWPGNVRELENVLGHGCMMTLGNMIDVQDLPDYLRFPQHGAAPVSTAVAPDEATFDDHEKRLIADTLAQANGNQSQAARALRIGRDALRYKMKKHGLL